MQTRAEKIQWIKDALSGKILENHKKEMGDALAKAASCDLLDVIINIDRGKTECPDFFDGFGSHLRDCKTPDEVETFVLAFNNDHKQELSSLSIDKSGPCQNCNERCLRTQTSFYSPSNTNQNEH